MTLSIAARCPRTKQFGVAAATEMPAVGKFLSYAFPGFGAFATQALVNPYLGIDGVKLLSLSVSARGTVETVLDDDAERHKRQVAAIDTRIDAVSRSFRVRAELPNSDAGLPGGLFDVRECAHGSPCR